MDSKILDLASGLREWTDGDDKLAAKDNCVDLLQQVRLNVNGSGVQTYESDMTTMQNGWQSKSIPHFTWDDTSPPMSHLGTPTEDFYSPTHDIDPSVQLPFSHHTSCISSHIMPITSVTTAITSPMQPIAPPPAVPPMMSTSPQQSIAINQFQFSTISDTPTPSPSSNEDDCSSTSPLSDKQSFVDFNEDLSLCKSKQDILKLIPKDVRVPQRKGNMQLWQFLYAILEDQTEIIEWTANKSEYEFRLLQPDVVAIWWGHQKNRQNMNYDKLSRSLRYYYNRKIITKVNSERYVYRFCCNPELLYSVLGNSHTKPKLKEMPAEAKQILEWNQGMPGSGNGIPAPVPQLLRAPSPSHIVAPVNYIHPMKSEVCLPPTCDTEPLQIAPNYHYGMSKPQPMDTSFIPPDYYYSHCISYSSMPAPPYPSYNLNPHISNEWDHYPLSI